MSRFGFRFQRALIAIGPNLPIIIGTAAGLLFNLPANSQYLLLLAEDF